MRVEANGIRADLPPGWEGEIVVRRADATTAAEEDLQPVAHLANFPLPPERGDFGSNAVEIMRADDLLVCVVEYDRASSSSELFASEGVPTVTPDDFSPESMQRALPGQSGAQRFFHVGDRAFCLYVVLGAHARRAASVDAVNEVLAGLDLS